MNHRNSEKIQNQRLIQWTFHSVSSSHFYTKEAERKNADTKQEKANCKRLTEIKRMSKKKYNRSTSDAKWDVT